LTPQEAFSDAADDAEMEMERIAISQWVSIPITAREQRFPSDVKWGLDSKKNLLPPLREKFVLDIPFHRTAEGGAAPLVLDPSPGLRPPSPIERGLGVRGSAS
jgi:hypothetical protein